MDKGQSLLFEINKVLARYGYTVAIQHNIRMRNGDLQLAVRAVDEEEAWKRIADNALLVTDFKWNWSKPFKFGGTLLTLIDFDSRHAKPWICADARGTIYHLSTKEVSMHALEPVAPPQTRDDQGQFVKEPVATVDYSKWG